MMSIAEQELVHSRATIARSNKFPPVKCEKIWTTCFSLFLKCQVPKDSDVKLSHPHLFVEATALGGAEATAHEAPVADASDEAEAARQALMQRETDCTCLTLGKLIEPFRTLCSLSIATAEVLRTFEIEVLRAHLSSPWMPASDWSCKWRQSNDNSGNNEKLRNNPHETSSSSLHRCDLLDMRSGGSARFFGHIPGLAANSASYLLPSPKSP